VSVEFADAHRDDAPTLFLEGCSCGPVECRHAIDRHVNPLLAAPALEDNVVAARITVEIEIAIGVEFLAFSSISVPIPIWIPIAAVIMRIALELPGVA
jgi:hypothetical protein